MPELALFLLIWRVVSLVLLHLNDETDLGGVAKVGNGQAANFLNERLSSQLHFILTLLNQVLYFVRLQLHDASNAQFGSPLALIEVTEDVLHVGVLLAHASALGRKVDEQLLIRPIRLYIVLHSVQVQNARTAVILWLDLASSTICLRGTGNSRLFLWNHAFFQLVEDGE